MYDLVEKYNKTLAAITGKEVTDGHRIAAALLVLANEASEPETLQEVGIDVLDSVLDTVTELISSED